MKWTLVLLFTLTWLEQIISVKNHGCNHESILCKVDRGTVNGHDQQGTDSHELKHLSTKEVAPDAEAVYIEPRNKGETENTVDLNSNHLTKRSFGSENSTKGEKGQKGQTGQKGQKGQRGYQGYNGYNGQKGQKGVIGSQGVKGQKGVKGTMGQKGDEGEIGPMGHTGIKGDKGSIGAKGDMGLPGTPANTTDLEIKQERAVKDATASSVSLSYASMTISLLTAAGLLCILCFIMRKIFNKLLKFCLGSRKDNVTEFELPPPLPPPYIPDPDEIQFTSDDISTEANSCYQTVTAAVSRN